ncbi:co-chaperone DjlA [Alteromonas sp. ASW11-36]|uniref:Co-chaperone protein DjlA n=1 Tax=Alteromonas arenosi TaxID=3055817 RepID=A0ABT7T1X7_9ALTE|nr:co-chaperone DjlA [Alteromonas sp. ASW11-36]MDM7861812.1 co-chaperone DjlA [Alteromonas sp. ASW11-36]
MAYWGKVIGFCLGFAAGKIPGAILGLIVGHMFDRGYSQDFSQMGGFGRFFTDSDSFKQQAIFFHTLFASLGHLAKADGAVTSEEIQVATRLMDEMDLSGEDRTAAQNAFREGKAADYPITATVKEFVESCHGRRDILQIFLEILIQASFSDGHLSEQEYRVLEKVARSMGFKRRELDYLVSMYEAEIRFRGQSHQRQQQNNQHSQYSNQQREADAYRILGVTAKASNAEIKKAYRKLMAQHHPDKLVSKGLPEQAMQIAKQKAQDIQSAYEFVKAQRGF